MVVTVRFTIRVTSLKSVIDINLWLIPCLLHLWSEVLITPVEWSYLNTDMRKFETSQKEPSRAFSCWRFACFLLFQTGKNRMQLNRRVKRCGFKNQNRRRKVLSRGLNFRKGTWHTENLIKASLICSVSYLHLERLSSPMPTVAAGMFQIPLMLSLLKYV